MSITRIRVEAKNINSNSSQSEKDRSFKAMFATFKKIVNDSGILTRYKEVQSFESKSQKRRRKERKAEVERLKEEALKARLREHFG